ncbi:hypothetical protein [Sorangium sp. So ce1099]|uniref:hypothetical protein n=1 Tax=Sorangium sp. So ce1099 TaxID=3133331 RepID=UPI003F61550F
MQSTVDATAELEPLDEIGDAWSIAQPGLRARAIRERAPLLRARLEASRPVVSVRTFDTMQLAYPTRYAFWGAALLPSPFAIMTQRVFLVQFEQSGRLKNLLFNPTDPEGALRAPYLERLRARHPVMSRLSTRVFAPLTSQLRGAGVAPEDIDYIAYDHFHLQDLRKHLGTKGRPAPVTFPAAELIAQRREWEAWDALHPLQSAFYVADGKRDVLEGRVRLIDGDVLLGDGVALVRTPGHSTGNQTLFFRTDRGIFGVSENGVSADNWSPLESRLPGVAARCKDQGLEVLLNLDTPESGADQYTSMLLERAVVDRVPDRPGFVQMVTGFEVTRSALAPGVTPTHHFGGLSVGSVRPKPSQAAQAPAAAPEARP